MSNSDNASPIPGEQDAAVNRLSLPSFTSTRYAQDRRQSQAESSTSGSRWSLTDRRSQSPSDFRVNVSMVEDESRKQNTLKTTTFPQRSQPRSSGGFLLEPTTHSTNLSRAVLSRSQQDVKGKRRSEASEISISKRRNRRSVLEQDSSVRSSPLSVEVKRDQNEPTGNFNAASLQKPQERQHSQERLNGTPNSRRSMASSVGFDTDPAQIVDMALKLSEGRRRQVSNKRYISGSTPQKRIASATPSRLQTPTKGLGQHVTSPATPSKTPLPDSSLHNGTLDGSSDPMVVDDPFAGDGLGEEILVTQSEVEISKATAVRVEKAKIYLELAYEHRRLLTHLPPVRRPGAQATLSAKTAVDSKQYNPLQYVRNRKLRIREKTAINAEVEGWHDVEKVRVWVDAIVNSRPKTDHDPLECVRLPPLSLREEDEDDSQSPKARTSPISPRQTQAKPRRPKSDWVTHPGDLLADAFWLEQGLNKTKIQDRDNNPIYPPNSPFKFSGWRNRAPVDIPAQLQQPTPPPDHSFERDHEPTLEAAPELPKFRSAHKQEKDKPRGRRRSKFKGSLVKNRSDSRRRKISLLDSSSDTDSDSDTTSPEAGVDGLSRGRGRMSKEFNLPNGDPFGRPISTLYDDSVNSGRLSISDPNLSALDSKRSSIDNSRFINYLKHNSAAKNPSQDRGRSRGDTKKHSFFHHRKDSKHDRKHGHSSGDDDSATTNSPVLYGLPSIAINLDAPLSRSPSPTKKSRSTLLQPFKDKSKQPEQNGIDTTDFAKRHGKSHSRGTSVDVGRSHNDSNETSRGTSPFTRGVSPTTKSRRESTPHEVVSVDLKSSTQRKQSSRPVSFPAPDQPSRIRGMFKGGRIAELVGTEVSRVGDFIWKREVPPAFRHQMSGSDASLHSYDPSDTDEDLQHGPLYQRPSRDTRASLSTQSSGTDRRSQEISRSNEKPQLYNPNLPSFTSPFQRDRERQEKKQDFLAPGGYLGSEDHISRQAAQHRSRSKSPRLDRIAPLKLDTSGPQSVGLVERRNSYGFGNVLNRSQSASRSLNDALNVQSGGTVSAKSSIAGLGSQLRKSMGSYDSGNTSNIFDKRELFRLKALLLISAVKARNIATSHDQVPPEPSKFLTESFVSLGSPHNNTQSSRVRKRDQHVIAAQNYITALTDQSNKINDQLHAFSNLTVNQLHKQIQSIEDQIENEITPRVRTAADNAGELGVKLTTTSTQAVKSMQDSITEAFRLRRRGPFRWVRLLGYTLIEWAVVGLLWFIWAIVTFVRLFTGLFKGIGRTVRWLLWID